MKFNPWEDKPAFPYSNGWEGKPRRHYVVVFPYWGWFGRASLGVTTSLCFLIGVVWEGKPQRYVVVFPY